MANTFDTPVVVTEVTDGMFRLFRGGGLPVGVPLREPTDLATFYQVSGPLEAFYHLSPPQNELTREEVLAWLDGVRMLGCRVREVEPVGARR